MLNKLSSIVEEFHEIEKKLQDPEIASDQKQYITLSKRRAQLKPLKEIYSTIQKYEQQKIEAEEMLKDSSMKELAISELEDAKIQLKELYNELKILLLPRDPDDDKNIIIEIRQAAGGEEAGLFAGELARAYLRFAEEQNLKTEIMHWQESESGGLKDAAFEIKGENVYAQFKYESGVHRVQRIPLTESQGRVHTSTCTVAVMPEVEEFDIDISQDELRIETYRAQGAGGQHVNTTDSAIRITHIKTGTVATCQDQRSQHRNKEKAMTMLRARIYKAEKERKQKESADARSSQVGTGDRSEKIRTYNFPQDRVTDHRIKKSWSNLPSIMNGGLKEMIENIRMEDQARKLAELQN